MINKTLTSLPVDAVNQALGIKEYVSNHAVPLVLIFCGVAFFIIIMYYYSRKEG